MTSEPGTKPSAGWDSAGWDSDPSRRPRAGFAAVLSAVFHSLLFASVTAFLLLINGSFTLIVFGMMADSDSSWHQRKEFLQLGLFAVPVMLVVVEWMAWDHLRGFFGKKSHG